MNNLIEKLKQNEKPTYMLSDEAYECLCNVPQKFLEYTCSSLWPKWRAIDAEIERKTVVVVRISPDYNPEPKVEKAPIEPRGLDKHYMFRYRELWKPIDYAIREKGFAGFLHKATKFFKNGIITNQFIVWIDEEGFYYHNTSSNSKKISWATHVLFEEE